MCIRDRGEHVRRARELATLVAKQAPLGVRSTLANARIGRARGEAAAVEHIRTQIPGLFASEDAREGFASFVERREAKFSGS